MKRAKRGFGSLRIALTGVMVIGGFALTACDGSSSGANGVAATPTGSGSSGGTSSGDGSSGSASGGSGAADGSGSSASAAAVNLQWAAPTENSDGTPLQDLEGYKIHYGTESQNYTADISVDNPTVTTYLVSTLPAGKYFFAVTAYNSSGAESSPSDEVSATLN